MLALGAGDLEGASLAGVELVLERVFLEGADLGVALGVLEEEGLDGVVLEGVDLESGLGVDLGATLAGVTFAFTGALALDVASLCPSL